jgi:hypothetical protein
MIDSLLDIYYYSIIITIKKYLFSLLIYYKLILNFNTLVERGLNYLVLLKNYPLYHSYLSFILITLVFIKITIKRRKPFT